MSASQIPDLRTLLGGSRGRGGPRLRGRGQGGAMAPPQIEKETAFRQDRLIQQTDVDAAVSRVSAVKAGYLHDPFAQEFMIDEPVKRFPIINRGTYARTAALDRLVDTFLEANPGDKQIISLGAGSDTRYFRLRDAGKHYKLLYHEIDFPKISANKLATIRSSKILSPRGSSFFVLHNVDPPVEPEKGRWGFHRNHRVEEGYLFHPLDLRAIDENVIPDGVLSYLPTLVISECCLCYLSVEEAEKVIRMFTNKITTLGIAIYEPTNPTSDFGLVMTRNLASRGLSMPTVHRYTTLQNQKDRLRNDGFWKMQDAATILWIWENWIPGVEKERINSLEMLDEVEEWELLAKHYAIAWAYRGLTGDDVGAFRLWDSKCPGPSSNRVVMPSPVESMTSAGTQPTGEDYDVPNSAEEASDDDRSKDQPVNLDALDRQAQYQWENTHIDAVKMTDKTAKYRAEIQQMMYVSGESAEPSHETTGMVEEIVRQQVIEMDCQLRLCTENASRRGVKSITTDDLIFLIRHDSAKVSRLRTFLSWKDVRKNVKETDDKGGEADIGAGEEPAVAGAGPVGPDAKKNKKAKVGLPWEVPSLYSQEVPERDDEEDEDEEELNYATLQRLKKADERTKAMTKEEYVTWSEYRQASFTFRKGKRFKEWAGFGVVTESKPNDDIVDILGFLTFEIVQTLTEEALKIKENEDLYKAKTGTDDSKKRKRENGLFDPPSEGRTPVGSSHIQEAFRRLQARPKKTSAMRGFTRGLNRTQLKLI
ncbi:MAG: Transcription initiation protein spt3 [Claussenomyces sp. TS43310]|nr:MAG: Transcription initiation protein spt3 [Claussenomyces sp. TS43310]